MRFLRAFICSFRVLEYVLLGEYSATVYKDKKDSRCGMEKVSS